MKRLQNKATNEQKKIVSDRLKENNCVDCKELQDSDISEVESNFEQVALINPKFLEKPWTVRDLLNESEKEHKELLQYLHNQGCEDPLEALTSIELFRVSATFDYCFKRGFQMSPWNVEYLNMFHQKYEKLFHLVGSKTKETPSMKELEAKEIQINDGLHLIPKNSEKPLLTTKQNIKSLVNAEYVQSMIKKAFDQISAGFAFVANFQIPTDEEENTNHANMFRSIEYISKTLKTAVEYLYHSLNQHSFFVSIKIDARLLNIDTQEIVPFNVNFPPKRPWSITSRNDIESLGNHLGELFEHLIDGSSYPDTVHRLHSVRSFTIKFALQSWAGCQEYIHKENVDFKGVKCVINPNGQDDLCFWRCVAIGLHQNHQNNPEKKQIYTKIKGQAPRNRFQTDEAIKIRNLYYFNKKEYEGVDFVKNPPPNRIVLNLLNDHENNIIRDVCEVLSDQLGKSVKIWVHTLQETTINGETFKAESTLFNEPPEAISDNDTIHLHYEIDKNHFLLITQFRSYGEKMKCPFCDKIYSSNHPEDLEKHRKEHIKSSNIAKDSNLRTKIFKKNKRISHMKSHTEELLGIETFVRPFFLAFDFEALLVSYTSEDTAEKTCKKKITKKHQPIGYVLKGHSAPDFKYKFNTISYMNEDCPKHLILQLEECQEDIVKALKSYYFKKYDKELEKICSRKCKCAKFKLDHQVDNYKQKPHKAPKEEHEANCKFVAIRGLLLRKEWSKIPIYGYNSGKYDLTFLVAHMLNPKFPIENIISRNNSYLKISYGSYDFLDAHNLVPMNVNLNRFAEMWGVKNISKEINAYDWLDDESKLLEGFPAIEHFYNSLKKEHCSQEDYDRALKLYNEKKFKNYGEWMMYYCERDVDLLIEGLNNYRKITLESSKMEICNYISISQIAYTNALKNYIKLPLYQIDNPSTFDVINNSIFGGNCQVFERHAKVGTTDSNGNEIKLIFSLDENNLYGHSLLKKIPYGKFTFCDDPVQCDVLTKIFNNTSKEQNKLDYEQRYSTHYLHSSPNDAISKGLYAFTGFICCSLYFTNAQKEKMKYFPPLPSRISPDNSFMRSDYMTKVKEGFGIKDSKCEKLIYSLSPQPEYYIYSEMLKYLLENDMITLERVHKFVYTPLGYVYHDYIQAMTNRRQQAEDMKRQAHKDFGDGRISGKERDDIIQIGDSLKEFAKLNNNSCYGKTLQSDENFDTSLIVKSKREFLTRTTGRALLDFNILAPKTDINDGSVEIKFQKDKYEIKSPKFIGSAALWNSKMLMIDFIYNCLFKVYSPEEVKIMYTDTDSLYMRIVQLKNGLKAPTTYAEFLARFDEKPEWRILKQRHFPADGELTCGKMKLEKNVFECVFLQPKCYCLDTEAKNPNDKVVQKMKGVSLSQNKHLEMNKYLESYNEGIRVSGANNLILKHSKVEMVTAEQNKFALTPYDDKRLWKNKNESEPWGFDEVEYVPDKVFARIVRNCAKRVKISNQDFLKYLGCSIGKFRDHIEEGMKEIPYCSYMNYKTYWNIDHTIPLSNRDLKDENILKDICHYSNLNPMTVVANSSKKNKEPKKDDAKERKEQEIAEIVQLINNDRIFITDEELEELLKNY